MAHIRNISGKLTLCIILSSFFIFLGNKGIAQDGKSLFITDCASCHNPGLHSPATGPALAHVEDRWPDRNAIHAWIKNSSAVIASGNTYTNGLFNTCNKTHMNRFQGILDDKQIDAILDWIKATQDVVPQASTTPNGTSTGENGDNTLLFGILTLILAIVAFVLLQVNSNLRKLSDDKEGIPAHEPIPFWRNKGYIAFATIIVFLIGGYYTVLGAIGLGHSQNYQPHQPIFYSHKVHTGTNQINCMYCHVGVYQGKQATIPSVNICMNCHMAINEYKGEQLYNADGDEVNGSEEIKKLYKYANYEPRKPWNANDAKPIAWVRIHNLPDHVYFNHSQHVVAGKVQCQTCHGEITKMNEVYQFADLSMGWCINCHRTTAVQFKDNGFYSIYVKYREALKNGSMDSVTVKDIGGTECQKCHY